MFAKSLLRDQVILTNAFVFSSTTIKVRYQLQLSERSPWTISVHLSSNLHSQRFYYLLKLAEIQWLGNTFLLKISFSIQKIKNKLSALKEKSCTFTPVERSLRQLGKLFRHLSVRTQQFRNTITNMTQYLFKINSNNSSKKPLTAQINCSKSTIKAQNEDVYSIPSLLRSGVFIVNFQHISSLVLLFLLYTFNKWT